MTGMSLRRRLVIIVCLAMIALGVAGLMLSRLRAQTVAAQEEAAYGRGDTALKSLVDAAVEHPPAGSGGGVNRRMDWALFEIVNALETVSVGYCRRSGEILALRSAKLPHPASMVPPGLRAPPPLPLPDGAPDPAADLLPADRALVLEGCRAARALPPYHAKKALPMDLLILSTRAVDDDLAAFVLLREPPIYAASSGGFGWSLQVFAMVLATALLVLLAVDAILALRRGAADLERGLLALQADLRSPIPAPRAAELSRIAAGLRVMADNLAEARERERTLERRLGHEQRLAGLGRVVAGVAHEVRNPLTGIKLKLDTMARRRLDERSTKDVGICLQEIARLDRVVSSLLVVAQKGPVERAAVDLAALADERLEGAAALAAGQGVALTREGSASALGNRESLLRVLDNLLRNAIEASPEGAAVRVLLTREGAAAILAVVDQGEGIPEPREPRARGARAHRAGAPAREGQPRPRRAPPRHPPRAPLRPHEAAQPRGRRAPRVIGARGGAARAFPVSGTSAPRTSAARRERPCPAARCSRRGCGRRDRRRCAARC